ncbi:MAG: T9SS type A sorting domain-containing protein [Chitinophagales bacterium]|nr:T9SS type A sorting domain-containing protein [Chitinophagales bacterium]
MQLNFLIASFLFSCITAYGQYAIDQSITVKDPAGNAMQYPWAGGFNNAQFSTVDLNNDGINDLFVFDRTGNTIYTFINHGTPNTINFSYNPEYKVHFPALENWALLLDYNCDGIADIFTHTHNPATGIRVFNGSYDANNVIQFQLADDLLEYPFNSFQVNLFVSAVDIPAIVDVNHDGDVDILTFQQNGGYAIYYENRSQENGHGCSDLDYEPVDQCWGDFFESGFVRADSLNVPCPFMTGGEQQKDDIRELRHTGSTLLAFDNDGDNDVELITGDISFSNIVYLHNGGTPADANINSLDTLFPSYNISADVYTFPAAFYTDVNNDGLRDLLVTPNNQQGTENYNCAWYYQNKGNSTTAEFDFQAKNFMVSDMIDVGEGACPVFFDADNDGLKDIIVGNYGYFDLSAPGIYDGQLAYYRNTGTATAPAFQLITVNYADVLSLAVKSVCPTFGDLDGDGDADMITGRDDGTLLYFRNIAASGTAADFVFMAQNYAGIDVGNFSTPQLVDVNHDGLPDLLIGERDGNLNYYRNTGTAANPVFATGDNFFGEVDVRQPGYTTGYSAPFLVQLSPGDPYTLFVGCERGFIFQYGNIDNNLDGVFTKMDSTYADIYQGLRSTVSGADADDDGKIELLVGNYRGGVTYYNQAPEVAVPFAPVNVVLQLFPNPAAQSVSLIVPPALNRAGFNLTLVNNLGESVLTRHVENAGRSVSLDVAGLPPGVYFARISADKNNFVGKLLISH